MISCWVYFTKTKCCSSNLLLTHLSSMWNVHLIWSNLNVECCMLYQNTIHLHCRMLKVIYISCQMLCVKCCAHWIFIVANKIWMLYGECNASTVFISMLNGVLMLRNRFCQKLNYIIKDKTQKALEVYYNNGIWRHV